MRQRGRRAARPITAQAPVAIALAIAYAWVTTGFSLSMSLLAALMACCAEVMAADAPDGAGSPDALSEERSSLSVVMSTRATEMALVGWLRSYWKLSLTSCSMGPATS